ncbi:trypsin-like peptidase domain-containing protein [Streptomyces sp. NPDC093591]|uniref:S1C family serine protease n=1 Tax=Streptomyces sp. NPDC093591 TaxID=3366044 RepID=UPI0037FB991E
MNEGKPAKAKWWNRPRPQGPSAPAQDTEPTPDEASGTLPGASNVTERTAPAATGEPGLGGEANADGDFELALPATRTSDAAALTEGDFELPRPALNGGGGAASAEGDFELPQPAVSGSGGDVASADGDFELARPGAVAASVPSAGDAAAIAGGADDAAAAAAEPADERPKPLHDPDPYSTPPYGEPGPWAPAPPVQHPAATPAQGTAVPVQAPPAHSLPAPMPGLPTPAQGERTSAHGTPAPSPAASPGVPAQPTPLGSGGPTPSSLGPGAPAPAAPASAAPATPAPVTPAAATPAPSPSVPTQPASPPAQATPDPAYADAPPPTNPWRNYDPWAHPTHPAQSTHPTHPSAPLQQTGAAVATEGQRRKRAKKVLLVGALLIAVVSGGVGGAVGAYLERNGGVGDVELPQAGDEPTGRAPDSVAGIAARALPSVVTLHVSGGDEQGTGTGFVLDDRGHILTNNHVVEPAGDDGEISVTFHSGDTAKATVVGRDSGYDLAVVKVTGVSGLRPLPLGNSDNVQVGDPVIAIGAPFDLAGTVTAGIISAKERPITAGGESGDGSDVSYVDALQTDAPINPGNSGGPLLDAHARVIGINSAIRSADTGSDLDSGQSGSIGLGFAIPVNQAKRVAEELINTGRATHPVIGVTLDMDYSGDGARVGTKGGDGGSAVSEGGPGDKAGIKSGDVITEVDGQRVHSGEELIVKTRAHRPGDRLELTLERGGKEIRISLTLGSSGGD